jgi:hypothetical protein
MKRNRDRSKNNFKLIFRRFQEIVSFIKTKGINQILTLNLYVDVFDNFNSWRNGYILDLMKDDYVKIRFDGWSSKYDEVIKLLFKY